MERSRTEHQQRLKQQRKRRQNRALLVITAAAALCAAAVWIWAPGSPGPDDSGRDSNVKAGPVSPNPAETVQPALTPAAETPAPSDTGDEPSPESSREAAATPAAPAASTAQHAPDGTGLRMSFVGDVIFAGNVETLLKQNGYDYPYRNLKEELQRPDITAANLETPITVRGTQQIKDYTYRSRPEALMPFKEAGFDVVNLANNHTMDFGVKGLLDTLANLDREGILRTGAGSDLKEAYQPAIIEKNGIKVAFLGFSHKVPDPSWKAGVKKPGTTQLYDPTLAIETIAAVKAQADLVVVMAHWGEEQKDKPLQIQRDMAKKFIDAGADLIIGSHPHVMQGFERYKDKWIAYSLGNFIFTTNNVASTWDTVILEAECSRGADCRLSAVPVSNKFAQPVKMGQEDAGRLFERLSGISFGARVDAEGRINSIDP